MLVYLVNQTGVLIKFVHPDSDNNGVHPVVQTPISEFSANVSRAIGNGYMMIRRPTRSLHLMKMCSFNISDPLHK